MSEIDRRDWGLKWNQALDTGGVMVGHNLRIDLEVQFVRQLKDGASPAGRRA